MSREQLETIANQYSIKKIKNLEINFTRNVQNQHKEELSKHFKSRPEQVKEYMFLNVKIKNSF